MWEHVCFLLTDILVNKLDSIGFFSRYKCPDGLHECQTRCYLFDTNAILIVAPEFIKEKDLEEKKYSQVNLGMVEGEIMKDLIYRHKFLKRSETIDFSGTCTISPYQPKVTLEGLLGFFNFLVSKYLYTNSFRYTYKPRGPRQLLQKSRPHTVVSKRVRLHSGRREIFS